MTSFPIVDILMASRYYNIQLNIYNVIVICYLACRYYTHIHKHGCIHIYKGKCISGEYTKLLVFVWCRVSLKKLKYCYFIKENSAKQRANKIYQQALLLFIYCERNIEEGGSIMKMAWSRDVIKWEGSITNLQFPKFDRILNDAHYATYDVFII